MVCLPPAASAIGAEAGHRSLDCGRCHGREGASVSTAAREAPVTSICKECHRGKTRTDWSDVVFHRDPGRSCTDCHCFHDPARVIAQGVAFSVDYDDRASAAHCASCHNTSGDISLISSGHRRAAAFYHVDDSRLEELSLSDGCLRCHGKNREAAGEDGAPAFAAHASHPYGVKVLAGRGKPGNHIRDEIDTRLPLFSDRMECQTCHQVAGEEKALLVGFPQPYGMCLGCHEQPYAPAATGAVLASAR